MISKGSGPRRCFVSVAMLGLMSVVATPAPAHAAPSVYQEGCELVASQEYNYYSAGGQHRQWPRTCVPFLFV